jgi:hypothetical protein
VHLPEEYRVDVHRHRIARQRLFGVELRCLDALALVPGGSFLRSFLFADPDGLACHLDRIESRRGRGRDHLLRQALHLPVTPHLIHRWRLLRHVGAARASPPPF